MSSDPAEPEVSTRRINAASKLLIDPHSAERVLAKLDEPQLANLIEASRQIQSERAVSRGDLDEIISVGFEEAFGGDGMGTDPYLVGNVVVCPGALIWTSKTSHTCRFISVSCIAFYIRTLYISTCFTHFYINRFFLT